MASYDDTTTVSGSVATFTNGSDEVYCKSVKATLPASLEGYDSVTIGSFGKNITDLSTYVDGYVNTNGTFSTSHTYDEMRSDFIRVEPNTKYCFHIVKTAGTYTAGIYIGFYSAPNVESFISRTSTAYITTPATAKYVVLSARNLATATQIQFELGNKNTGYEPCQYRSYEVPLGRTIYGGTVDIVNGEGTDENGNDFTFTGCNIPTRFGDNSIYNELDYTNNLEVTYYKRGYGYSSATLNRAVGKNLFDMVCYYGGAYNPSVGAQWDLKVNIAQFTDNGDGSFSLTAAGSGYTYTFLIPVRHGVSYHFKMTFTSTGTGGLTLGYLDGTYKVLSNTTSTAVPNNVDTNLTPPTNARYYYIVVTNRTTAGATISLVQPQMEFGSSASQYEPYVAPVSASAKLHKIIYGGEVDVIRGTAKPKNLGELSEETYNQYQRCTWEYTNGGVVITATGTYARVGFVIPVTTGKTYTISYRGFSDAGYRRVYLNSTVSWSGQFHNNILTDTDTAYTYTFTATTNTLFIGLYVTTSDTTGTMTFSDLMLEEGSSASEYTPYFEPFNFTPVNFNTVEGENTLYASEGDSVITYRKETD